MRDVEYYVTKNEELLRTIESLEAKLAKYESHGTAQEIDEFISKCNNTAQMLKASQAKLAVAMKFIKHEAEDPLSTYAKEVLAEIEKL